MDWSCWRGDGATCGGDMRRRGGVSILAAASILGGWGQEKVLRKRTIPLRIWMHPARPRHYIVKIYLDEIDTLAKYGSIFT